MAKKFLAVIGNGQNDPCIYKHNDKLVETCFAQEALVKMMCNQWNKDDKLVIFLTEGARKKNWEGENGLKVRLEKVNPNVQIVEKPIKDGENELEIAEIFDVIRDSIEDDDEIIFDITNAFRFLPMMVLAVICATKTDKNTKIDGIYYGKFNGKDKIAPIIDLTYLYKIIEGSYEPYKITEQQHYDMDYFKISN